MSLMFSKVLPDIPNYLSVNSTGDTILELEVHFGNGVIGENGGIRDITYWRVCQLEATGETFAARTNG